DRLGHAGGEDEARGGEPADAEERRVAEADLPDEAAHPVPGERAGDHQEREREEVVAVGREVENDREEGGDEGDERDATPRAALHRSTRWPKRPPGLTTRTMTSMTKPTAAVRYDGRMRIAKTSATARMSAATPMPNVEPRPPRTTTTKDLRSSPE